MKTIKTLLKELLYGSKPQEDIKPEENPASENQQKSLTQNQNNDETETIETSGPVGMDHPDACKSDGDNQEGDGGGIKVFEEAEESETVPSPEKSEEAASAEVEKEKKVTEPPSPIIKEVTTEIAAQPDKSDSAAVDEAYQKGFIDGKNAQIEEKYFPKSNDGLPHFRGRQSKPNYTADIFSMAREA